MRSRAGVLLALFVLSAAAALTSGRQLFANLAYLLGFLLAASYLWSRISLSGVTLRRRAPSSRSQVGVPFEEHFALTNTSRFPKVWVEIEDRSDFPNHQVSTVFTNLDARGARSWTVRTMCVRRGRFHLGPGTLRGGDPFGIFPVAQFLPESQSVVVLPMVLPLAHFPVPSGRRGGGEALRQRTHQVTPNASGVRDYAPGDSLNRIHWPSTARRRRLIAKEFELDPMADAWLLLDASHRSQSSLPAEPTPARRPLMGRKVTLPPSTIEYAVTAAASIALYLLNRSQSVGLIAHGKVREVIQADRGTAQLYRLLESLAVLEPSGSLSLQDVLKVEQAQIPRGAAVVLITASTELSVVDAARRLKRSGLPPVLVLLDASSFGGRPGSAALLEMAQSAGIPTRMIRCGEMVGMALERPVDAASAVAA